MNNKTLTNVSLDTKDVSSAATVKMNKLWRQKCILTQIIAYTEKFLEIFMIKPAKLINLN